MTFKAKEEWVQQEWNRAGVGLWQKKGDFDSLSSLYPDRARRKLARAPSWQTVDLPTGFTSTDAIFFDGDNRRYVFVGTYDGELYSCYANSSWTMSAVSQLTAVVSYLGGKRGYNCVYWGGDLYVIGSNGKVYRGSSYSGALSEFYATGDAQLLATCGDRMFMVTTAGTVYRLNDADDAFASFFDPVGDLDVRLLIAFRGYLALVAVGDDGLLHVYRLPGRSPLGLADVGLVQGSGVVSAIGPWALVHRDELHMMVGHYWETGGTAVEQLHTFNGSRVEHVTEVAGSVASVVSRAGELLVATWDGSTNEQKVCQLVGGEFSEFSSVIYGGPAVAHVCCLGDELVAVSSVAGADVCYHTEAGEFDDGYLVTSKMDMGHPGKLKLLTRLTVLLDGDATDFKIPVKYRVNDGTTWVPATTGNDTRRVSVDLAVEFYTLQIRVDLDDDTAGGGEDIRVEAVSVLYSMED